MPNAAIGWKQPNGFYYPPAFPLAEICSSTDVDYRHFVVTPLFKDGTYRNRHHKVGGCTIASGTRNLFTGFAGNDRQTVLNDDDGTLTGYKDTTVINMDDFFAAPVDAIQCRSDNTSRTSPYEYVTTVLYPACVIDGTCARPPIRRSPPRIRAGMTATGTGLYQRELLRHSAVAAGPYAARRTRAMPRASA